MSSKSSLILSEDNEHLYHETMDDSFVIEVDTNNYDIVIHEDYLELTIKPNTDLAKRLIELKSVNP